MFPGQPGGPFGPPSDGSGPPSSDAMFENFLGDEDDLVPEVVDAPSREDQILEAGLKFFDKMKKMK